MNLLGSMVLTDAYEVGSGGDPGWLYLSYGCNGLTSFHIVFYLVLSHLKVSIPPVFGIQ